MKFKRKRKKSHLFYLLISFSILFLVGGLLNQQIRPQHYTITGTDNEGGRHPKPIETSGWRP